MTKMKEMKETKEKEEEKKKGKGVPVPVVRSAAPAPRWGWDRDIERVFDRWFDDFPDIFRWPRLWDPDRWLPSRALPSRGLPSREIMRLQTPAVDVYDEKDEVVVKADLPGIAKDEIEVSLSDSRLTIKGEKKKEVEVKEENYYRWERAYGAFARTVDLPAAVKADAVKATFKDGVLEVRLPKTEEAKQKPVKVKVE